MPVKDVRLAVLIDADNISASYIKPMMLEIARYGNPTIKRIYGDWTKPQLGPWKQVLLDHAISPVQQFGYTSGKNATDSTLIIDAMDILYTESVDGFCLVSSDSDFTRLATRLREAGKIVYGIGEKKTPTPLDRISLTVCSILFSSRSWHRRRRRRRIPILRQKHLPWHRMLPKMPKRQNLLNRIRRMVRARPRKILMKPPAS